MTDVLDHFRRQADSCRKLGSPFTGELLDRAAEDIAAGGVLAELIGDWPGDPQADALSLRLAGALHAATLLSRDADLAASYPAAEPKWTMDQVWPRATAFLRRDASWVREFLKSPPQTNEAARATGLTAAFLWLAARAPQPFHMLELGASAGLNLSWDRFRYMHAGWGCQHADGPEIPTVISGQPPEWSTIDIADRAGCDQFPLDPSEGADRLKLRSYIWADQGARRHRLDVAIELAAASPWRVEKADAATWIQQRLRGALSPGLTVVYHSVFLQYPPKPVRDAITMAIEGAGARATQSQQLAWVRFEPESLLGGAAGGARFWLNVVLWDGVQRHEQTLAEVDPHGRKMAWGVG